jgi:hypothetical protein
MDIIYRFNQTLVNTIDIDITIIIKYKISLIIYM